MQAPEENIRGHFAGLHHFQQQLARRLNDDPRHQWHERLVFGRGLPAVLIGSLLGAGDPIGEWSITQFNELLKLRGENTVLQNAEKDETAIAAKAWLTKVNKLKQRLEVHI